MHSREIRENNTFSRRGGKGGAWRVAHRVLEQARRGFKLAYQSLLLHHDALRAERQGQATQRYRCLVEDVQPAFSIPGRKKDDDGGRENNVRALTRLIRSILLAGQLEKVLRVCLEMGLSLTSSWKAERGVNVYALRCV